MPGFSYVATLVGSGGQSVDTLTDIDIGWAAAGPTLYATSRTGQAITSFDLGPGAAMLLGHHSLPADLAALGPLHLDLIELDGQLRAVSLTGTTPGLPSYTVEGSGALDPAPEYLSAEGMAPRISALASARIGDARYLWVAESGQAGITGFQVGTGASLTQAGPSVMDPGLTDAGGTPLADPLPRITTMVTDEDYLFAASATDHRVFSYLMQEDGTLQLRGSIGAAEGLGLNAPAALAPVQMDDQRFVIVAATGSSSLSVLQVDPDGGLRATDHLVDDRTSRFQNVVSIDTVVHDGQTYVIAGGADDGLSLLTLLPNGRLIHLAVMADQAGLSLQNVSAVRAADIAGDIQVFAGSAIEAGLTQLRVETGTPGDLVRAPDAGGRSDGTAGDDIVMDGPGKDSLYGGAGRDIFVFDIDGRADHIRDFQAGLDRVDLSAWPMLRGLGQLSITANSDGATIRFGAEAVHLHSLDAQPLSPVQVAAAVMPSFLHHSVAFLSDPMTLTGTDGDDILRGGAGNDTLDGGAGADLLIGAAGRDTASYATSAAGLVVDLLDPDRNTGAAQGDRFDSIENLLTGTGDDSLGGDTGANLLRGGQGDDILIGRGGKDVLRGGQGNDLLIGGAGADRLIGGGGRDRVDYGSSPIGLHIDMRDGTNSTGDAAGDRFARIEDVFGTDFDDRMLGTATQNRLYGGAGSDRLAGQNGADMLFGGAGRDWLDGGAGDDILRGGGQNDTFIFKSGQDRIADFSLAQGDVIALKAALLWVETLTADQVITQFAQVQGRDVVLDFGADSLTITGLSGSLSGSLGADLADALLLI